MTTIIKSEKLADRWEIETLHGTTRTRFSGPSNGLGPVFISHHLGANDWTEPVKVIEPERFAMANTAHTAVTPSFGPSWVHNFCGGILDN